jgi:hypothetical protein
MNGNEKKTVLSGLNKAGEFFEKGKAIHSLMLWIRGIKSLD